MKSKNNFFKSYPTSQIRKKLLLEQQALSLSLYIYIKPISQALAYHTHRTDNLFSLRLHTTFLNIFSRKLMEPEMSLADALIKVAMFVLVQVLVYLILSNSSDIFSENKKKKMMKSSSFKTARSVSIRRMLAAISDLPSEAEVSSPSLRGSRLSDEFPISDDKES